MTDRRHGLGWVGRFPYGFDNSLNASSVSRAWPRRHNPLT